MKAEQIKNFFMPSSLYPNPGKKWLWIRIHKNAGTSMFNPFLIEHCFNIVKRNPNLIVDYWVKSLSNDLLKDYFIWSFVRNPYDRFMSISAMFKSDPNFFVQLIKEGKITKPIILRHSEQQNKFTHSNGVCNCNFIGRFENLQNDFDFVCDMIEVKRFKLPKLNETNHSDYRKAMTKETMKYIEDKYKLDFEYYGY